MYRPLYWFGPPTATAATVDYAALAGQRADVHRRRQDDRRRPEGVEVPRRPDDRCPERHLLDEHDEGRGGQLGRLRAGPAVLPGQHRQLLGLEPDGALGHVPPDRRLQPHLVHLQRAVPDRPDGRGVGRHVPHRRTRLWWLRQGLLRRHDRLGDDRRPARRCGSSTPTTTARPRARRWQATSPPTARNKLWAEGADGPWMLSAFDASSGQATFVPNPNYSGPQKPIISKFIEVPYTSDTAEYSSISTGGASAPAGGLHPAPGRPAVRGQPGRCRGRTPPQCRQQLQPRSHRELADQLLPVQLQLDG